ncbi:VOC family protein [Nonomuraea sp. NPDC049421]|uniref:VOC family protein n=1 Tax=Nonomuraea sp. NPDC049421 TaxID=3155275 RepID=UPI0034412979
MARLQQVVVDCETPAALARFWAAALDEFDIRPYDEAEIARLASLGYTPETDPSVILDGPHLEICFQKVQLEPRSKTPVHFDIVSAAWLSEIDRLVGLGANVKERFEAHAWMRDPEGNDFCVVDGDHGGSGLQHGDELT